MDKPFGIAIGSQYLYWATEDSGEVWRSDLEGHDAAILFTPSDPATAVAVDATHIYWTSYSAKTIWRSDLTGGSPTRLVAPQASGSYGIAVDSTHVYWTQIDEPGGVWRAELDGSNLTQVVTDPAHTFGIAVNGSRLYWTQYFGGELRTSSLSGGSPTALVTGEEFPRGIAIDGSTMYWINAGSGSIRTAATSGGAATTIVPGGALYNPVGIAANPFTGPAPTVSSISPRGGTVAGGETVTIHGTGFDPAATASLGGSNCVVSGTPTSSSLTCSTTSHSPGIVGVQVANPDSQIGTLTNAYTYVATPALRKQSQTKRSHPSYIRSFGITTLNHRNARTVQGQPMSVRVTSAMSGLGKRGDFSCIRILRGPKRTVRVNSSGLCAGRISVTYTAPGNSTYQSYRRTFVYKIKKVR